MLPAWKIFNHETIRLLTFKVKCNKMDFGKFWVWHVAACTLFSSWKKCGILRTYVQLWCMVQTCCAWMRLWRVMAQRQDHPSSSHLPATPAVQQAQSSELPPNHGTDENRIRQNSSGAALWSPLPALGAALLKACSSSKAAQKPTEPGAEDEREDIVLPSYKPWCVLNCVLWALVGSTSQEALMRVREGKEMVR